MRLRLLISLLVFSLLALNVGANVRSLDNSISQHSPASKKPTPSPTPPLGPNTSDPGGPGDRAVDRIDRVQTSVPLVFDRRRSSRPDGAVLGNSSRANYSLRPARRRPVSRRLGYGIPKTCNPTEHEEEDLTGTYSGRIEFPSSKLSGRANLTIEGTRFNLISGDLVLSGLIASETTCDYTAVAMRFETASSPEIFTELPKSISLRGTRLGSKLSLISAEGETKLEFTAVAITTRQP